MAALVVLAGLAFAAFVFTFAVFALLLKLAIRVILFPLFLLKWIITGVVMVVVGPILAIVGVLLALVLMAAVAVPLLPLIALAMIVWLLVRSTRRPAVI